jgi:hypothetical protein
MRKIIFLFAVSVSSLAIAQSVTPPPFAGGSGVSSVGITTPPIFTSGAPVTTSGNVSFSLNSQSANTVFIAPDGSAGVPAFRALSLTDIPSTAPYTNLNVSQNILSMNVGGCIPSDYEGFGAPNYVTSALVGCVFTPAGTYSGITSWPDNGVLGIAIAGNARKAAVGVTGAGGMAVPNTYAYGGNFTVVNCRLYAATCAHNSGFDFVNQYAVEADVNLYTKAGGVMPNGRSTGVVVQLNSDVGINAPGVLDAYNIVKDPGTLAQFKVGYATEDGSALVGLYMAANSSSATSASQTIQLSTVFGAAAHISSIQADATGLLNITGYLGNALNGITTVNGSTTVVANSAGVYPASCGATGFAMTANFITGSQEGDFINCSNTGGGFAFYQKSGASTGTQIFRIDGLGKVNSTTLSGGLGTPPTFVVGAGAGTGATVVCLSGHVCDNVSGDLSLTTGTATAAGNIVNVNFGITRSNFPNCTVSISSAVTAYPNGIIANKLPIDTASPLTASLQYSLNYICMGN